MRIRSQMMAKHMPRHPFDHALGHAAINHSGQRHRQAFIANDGFHPCP